MVRKPYKFHETSLNVAGCIFNAFYTDRSPDNCSFEPNMHRWLSTCDDIPVFERVQAVKVLLNVLEGNAKFCGHLYTI